MSNKNYIFVSVALLVSLAVFASENTTRRDVFTRAGNLYDQGLYQQARQMFETISGDPVVDGYITLCALQEVSDDAETLCDFYARKYGRSAMLPQIDFLRASNRFDAGDYPGALRIYDGIDTLKLRAGQVDEYVFKRSYCLFDCGDSDNAYKGFVRTSSGAYSAPSTYYLALISYTAGRYGQAKEFFRKCRYDARYSGLSDFYIVECEFKDRNYEYVIREGVRLFDSVPDGRREHLARIISESYLVRGDNENARRYYDMSYRGGDMSMADYFYAANVMMGVNDYPGAIDNFNRYIQSNSARDSLWQLANYNLAGAYMKTGNQVGAMNAFKAASELSFDTVMTEDASFNYAKLAFDLNKDTSGFSDYLRKYSTGKRDDIYTYMALAALYDRNYAAAVEAYDNIDYLTPDMRSNYAKANFLRAYQLMNVGSYSEAGKCLKAASYYLPRTGYFYQLTRYWLAETCYKTGDYASAGDIYSELHNGSALYGQPESLLMPYNIAYCHFKKGDYDSAAKWFDKYLDGGNDKFGRDAMLRRADCDFARKKYKDAVQTYGRVIADNSVQGDIYPVYKQALSYGLSGNKKMKLRVLSSVENADPAADGFFEALKELGNTYMDQKKNEDAIRVFSRLRDVAVDSSYLAEAYIGLGMVNRNMKEYDEALINYKHVVSAMPGTEYSDNALAAIQSIYQTVGKPELYMEFVNRNSDTVQADDAQKEQLYFSTGEQMYLAGRYKDALNTLNGFVTSYPSGVRLADAYFYIADCYKNLGDLEKANEYFQKVPVAGGGNFLKSALLNGATLSYGMERYAQALDGFRALRECSTDSSEVYVAQLGIMRSAYRARSFDLAIQAAKAVSADSLSDGAVVREADYTLAKSYLSTSRRDDAIREFRVLSEKAPSTPEGAEATCFLIQDLYDNGEFDKVEAAVFDFSRNAGNQSYWLAKAYVILGDTFVQKGNLDQARATFESIRDGYEPYGDNDEVPDNVKMRLERLANN